MDDLVDYADGATHGPLVQAALVHAQFETIHPFGDGNGRIGRALIHAILRRRGLTPAPVLPISMILHTWSDHYVGGLTAFRAVPGDRDALRAGVAAWISTFTAAADAAVDQAERIARDIVELREDWAERFGAHRAGLGLRPVPRADSVDAAIIEGLPEASGADAEGRSTVVRHLGDLGSQGVGSPCGGGCGADQIDRATNWRVSGERGARSRDRCGTAAREHPDGYTPGRTHRIRGAGPSGVGLSPAVVAGQLPCR